MCPLPGDGGEVGAVGEGAGQGEQGPHLHTTHKQGGQKRTDPIVSSQADLNAMRREW